MLMTDRNYLLLCSKIDSTITIHVALSYTPTQPVLEQNLKESKFHKLQVF
jgi:hypothetical protein